MKDNLYLFAVLKVNEIQDAMTPEQWAILAQGNAKTAAELYELVMTRRQLLIDKNIDYMAGADR